MADTAEIIQLTPPAEDAPAPPKEIDPTRLQSNQEIDPFAHFKQVHHGYVVVKPAEYDAQITAGGIYLPQPEAVISSAGKVVAVGPGKQTDFGTRKDMPVKVGDDVIFLKHAGTEYYPIRNAKPYIIVPSETILVTIDKDAPLLEASESD